MGALFISTYQYLFFILIICCFYAYLRYYSRLFVFFDIHFMSLNCNYIFCNMYGSAGCFLFLYKKMFDIIRTISIINTASVDIFPKGVR